MMGKKKAFTLIELVLSIGLLLILLSIVIVIVNPGEQMEKGKDSKKLSDLSKFDIEINKHKLEYGVYPELTPPANINYFHTEITYELNTDLLYYVDYEVDDGGNDPNLYEVGNDLTLN